MRTRFIGLVTIFVLAACSDRRLVTGIGFTVARTLSESSHATVDMPHPTQIALNNEGRLAPEYSHMQHYANVTIEYGNEPIAVLGPVTAAVGVGAGYVIEVSGALPSSSPASEFTDTVRYMVAHGWTVVTTDSAMRPSLDPNSEWHCPEPKRLRNGDRADSWLQLRHPSEIMATFQVGCDYPEDRAPRMRAQFTIRAEDRGRGFADPPYYQEPVATRGWRELPTETSTN